MKKQLRKCACGYAKCSRWTIFGNLRCKEDGHSVNVGENCKLGKVDFIPDENEKYKQCSYKCKYYCESLITDPKCKKDYGYIKKGGNCRHGLIEKLPDPKFMPALSTVYQSTVCPKCGYSGGYDINECEVRFRHQSSREMEMKPNRYAESDLYYSVYDLTIRSYYSPCPKCGYWRHVQDDVIDKEFVKSYPGG